MNMDAGKPKIVKKAWGQELWMANNQAENYCGKILTIDKGYKSSMHFHLSKHETFYVLKGSLAVHLFNLSEGEPLETVVINEGETYELDRVTAHQLEALEQLELIEISTFHRDEDSYRIYR